MIEKVSMMLFGRAEAFLDPGPAKKCDFSEEKLSPISESQSSTSEHSPSSASFHSGLTSNSRRSRQHPHTFSYSIILAQPSIPITTSRRLAATPSVVPQPNLDSTCRMTTNGTSSSSSSSQTPSQAWIRSIDSVYTLFEDPSILNLYPDLSSKVKHAVRLCEQVILEVGQSHCALSFNGGKDCTVLVHILSAVLRRLNSSSANDLPSIKSLYITCPSPFPTVEKFIRYSVKGYNLDLISVEGGMKQGIRTYLDGGGRHKVGLDESEPDSGEGAKVPREIKAMFVGTRRDDPHGPQLSARSWTDKDWPRVERIHPILEWTYGDVWAFLRCPHLGAREESLGMDRERLAREWGTAGGGEWGVPYCLLYDQGYTSLGSTFNTLPNPELRVEEEEGEGEVGTVGDGTAKGRWKPAYMLQDGTMERAGRVENSSATLQQPSSQQP